MPKLQSEPDDPLRTGVIFLIMEKKKSFIIHKDSLVILSEMTDEQAGKLFKAIACYQLKLDCDMDFTTKIAFASFKAQFERDDIKYIQFIEKQSAKGKQSAEARANRSQPRLTAVNHSQPSSTYSDSDSDSVSDSVKDNDNKKESKKKKQFEPPTIEQVKEYFVTEGYKPEIAEKFFKYYNTGEWKDSKGKPIRSWKQKAQAVWFKPENSLGSQAITAEQEAKRGLRYFTGHDYQNAL